MAMENITNTTPATDNTTLLERLAAAATIDEMLQIAVEDEEVIAENEAVALAEERFDSFKKKLAEYLLGCVKSEHVSSYEIELDKFLGKLWVKSESDDAFKSIEINADFSATDVANHIIQSTKYSNTVEKMLLEFGFEAKGGYFYKKICSAQILRS